MFTGEKHGQQTRTTKTRSRLGWLLTRVSFSFRFGFVSGTHAITTRNAASCFVATYNDGWKSRRHQDNGQGERERDSDCTVPSPWSTRTFERHVTVTNDISGIHFTHGINTGTVRVWTKPTQNSNNVISMTLLSMYRISPCLILPSVIL